MKPLPLIELAIAITLAVVPHSTLPRDAVARLELNHYHDEQGREVFTQVIGWEADDRCRFWRMSKLTNLRPERDHYRGGWVLTWVDGERVRQVRADSFEETWTQFDPELVDRSYLAVERRRPLK